MTTLKTILLVIFIGASLLVGSWLYLRFVGTTETCSGCSCDRSTCCVCGKVNSNYGAKR
jgi:hypothetical protein